MAINEILGTAAGEDLIGSSAADRILAGAGDDAVDAYDGDDIVRGGDGDDLISGGGGDDRIAGGDGNDRITASFIGSIDRDTIWGGSGDDFIGVNSPNGGEVYGGSGFDTLSLNLINSDSAVSVAIPLPGATSISNPNGLLIRSIEALGVSSGRGDDTVGGANHADHFMVHAGANTVNAHGGADFVSYHSGAANRIDCGDGLDTVRVVHFVPGPLLLSVTDMIGSDNFGSVIVNAEHFEVYGGSDDDQVSLGARADVFSGADGADSARGRGGMDTLLGGPGDDTLHGGTGDDSLAGGRGADLLGGGAGRDLLRGGDGDDTLVGGDGRDVLMGGAGADVFRFDSLGGSPDVLRGMETGVDRIWIDGGLIGGALVAGAVAAAQFSPDAAVGANAQFVYVTDPDAAYGKLYWDANGAADGGQTLLVKIYAQPALEADDLFIT